jgi:hypothetical protein
MEAATLNNGAPGKFPAVFSQEKHAAELAA